MKSFVEITVNGDTCMVNSPYYPPFVQQARQFNGKWKAPNWCFDARMENEIREACLRYYGEDGKTDVPRVTCHVDFYALLKTFEFRQELPILGRVLCSRKSRDWAVKLGHCVSIVSGGFPKSGGSMKHPRLEAEEGTVLKVFDVPLSLARYTAEKHPGVTIVDEVKEREEVTLARRALQSLTPEELVALFNEFR